MKLLLICFVALIAIVLAEETPTVEATTRHSRGCRYILGRCIEDCLEGTHAYTTGCSPRTPEATCDEPNPVQERHALCDYSSCYCDHPTVRDTVSDKCVKLEDCPKKS